MHLTDESYQGGGRWSAERWKRTFLVGDALTTKLSPGD